MKRNRILYYISTGGLTLIMLASVGMYFFNTDEVRAVFTQLGYPSYLVYPLAIAKVLGLIAVWTRRSNTLLEWAYAGFFFDTLLAATAHTMISDDGQWMALVAMLLVFISYRSEKLLRIS